MSTMNHYSFDEHVFRITDMDVFRRLKSSIIVGLTLFMPSGNGQADGEWDPSRLGDHYELFEDIVKALSLTMDLVEQASHEHAQRVAGIALNLGGRSGCRIRSFAIYITGTPSRYRTDRHA